MSLRQHQNHSHHTPRDRSRVLLNLKKAFSSLERLIRKTGEGTYCVDLMQQNLAVIGLLKVAQQKLMEDHLHTCFLEAVGSSDADKSDTDKQERMVEEILCVTKFSQRS